MFSFIDLKQPNKSIAKITLACLVLPFLVCFMHVLYSDIKGISVFYLFTYIVYGGILIALAGFIYLFVDNNLKRKVLNLLMGFALYLLLLPITWGIGTVKMKLFMYKNSAALEQIANNIITNKWTIEKSNKSIGNKYPLTIIDNIEKEKTILFQIDGVTDNCSGIAYSVTGKEPSINSCGRLTNWSHIGSNWYEWTTD